MFRSSIRVTLIGLKSRVFRLGIGSALLGLLLSILVPLSNAYSSDQGALPLPPSHPKLDAFKKLVGADLVHKLGYTGKGVTVRE